MCRHSVLLKILSALILLLLLAGSAFGASNFLINIKNVNCSNHFPDLISGFDCRLENVLLPSRQVISTMNAEFSFARPHKPHIWAQGLVRIKPKTGKTYNVIDLQLDICDFLLGNALPGLLKVLLRNLLESVNVTPECPLRTNFTYKLTHFHFNTDDYPNYFPEAMYLLEFNTHERDMLATQLKMWVDVTYQKAGNNVGGKGKRKRH